MSMVSRANDGAVSSRMREVSRSLRPEIRLVSGPLATPCATSESESVLMSAAQCTRDARSFAWRIADEISRTDIR